jgi:hypothetical protein
MKLGNIESNPSEKARLVSQRKFIREAAGTNSKTKPESFPFRFKKLIRR